MEKMNAKEIITFQFGNYSNYVGSNWWNLQEYSFNFNPESEVSEIDHGVLFREGLNEKGYTTFTPRLMLVDLSENVSNYGSSLLTNILLNLSDDDELRRIIETIPWEQENIEILSDKKDINKTLNSKLEDFDDNDIKNVNSWTEVLYTKFHPRSVNILNQTNPSKSEDLDCFSNGANLWASKFFQENFIDNIRKYSEECNNCQGFQTLFDSTNGFAGLADRCSQYLKDEYGKTNLSFPIFSPSNILFCNADEKLSYAIKLVNIVLSYANAIENSDLLIPLCTNKNVWNLPTTNRNFPFINYDPNNLHQTSSILATYLETMSLKYRFGNTDSFSCLSEFCSELNCSGRKIGAAGLSLPFQMYSNRYLIDTLNEINSSLITQISPNCEIGNDDIIQTTCVRGIPKELMKKPLHLAKQQMSLASYKCSSVSEMFQLYFQCSSYKGSFNVCSTELPLKIRKPFPDFIFDHNLDNKGFLSDVPRNSRSIIKSVPTVATLQTSSDIGKTLQSLYSEAKRVNVKKLHRFVESDLEYDEFIEKLEAILKLKFNYENKMDL